MFVIEIEMQDGWHWWAGMQPIPNGQGKKAPLWSPYFCDAKRYPIKWPILKTITQKLEGAKIVPALDSHFREGRFLSWELDREARNKYLSSLNQIQMSEVFGQIGKMEIDFTNPENVITKKFDNSTPAVSETMDFNEVYPRMYDMNFYYPNASFAWDFMLDGKTLVIRKLPLPE